MFNPFTNEVCINWNKYQCLDAPNNFFHHFRTNILRLNKNWSSSFNEWHRSFDVKGRTHWMVFMKFDNIEEEISEYGVSVSKKGARDCCSFRLFLKFERIKPDYLMPPFVVGYPNVRGHCFLIAAILPLLHSYPFVFNLMESYGQISRLRNSGILNISAANRVEPEVPNYWTNLIYYIYTQYFGVSATSLLRLDNVAGLAARLTPLPLIWPAFSQSKRSDLDLDQSLVSGLASSLRDYCNNSYATPGGFEAKAYTDILFKLSSENEIWRNFFLRFSCTFYCERCTRGLQDGAFQVPIICLSPGTSIQLQLNDINKLLTRQEIYCSGDLNGFRCFGRARKVTRGKLENRPSILCFYAPESDDFEETLTPEEIIFTCENIEYKYFRFVSSNVIECWRSKDGKDFGHFYHVANDTDEFTGNHTYLTIKTTLGFVEVNNGYLYECDMRLFGKTTPGSIHIYQNIAHHEFLPAINLSQVTKNPYY